MNMLGESELIAQMLGREPNLGSGDVSKCLPGWITTFCSKYEHQQGYALSHGQVGNLLHTMVAARIRAARLAQERDDALRRVSELENA